MTETSFLELCSNRFESWRRSCGLVEKILLYLARLRKENPDSGLLHAKARNLLVSHAQRSAFGSAIHKLSQNLPLPPDHPLTPLDPFLDEYGIMRVGGRLRRAPLPFEERHPVILPKDSPITRKIWTHYHEAAQHLGRHVTNATLRRAGFFILKGRNFLSKMLLACVTCRRLRAPCESQKMADLPTVRLQPAPPFENTVVDVFGPFWVHDGRTTRRSTSKKKVWVLICVCLVSRAIHLEPLNCLDTNSVLLALRRFQAIRGTCKHIRSDHGTNFIGAVNQEDTRMVLEEVRRGANSLHCTWEMIPPYASHFAGVWERKVASVKNTLYATLVASRGHFSREEFATWLQEAAAIVNSTPLGEISQNPLEPMPVSPANLLTLREDITPNLGNYSAQDLQEYGKLRWKRIQFLAEDFWRRWKEDYLHQLQERRKWLSPRPNLRPGDIVLLKGTSERMSWPFGRIVEATPDQDGLVRKVKVKCASGRNGNPKIFERAVHQLVKLYADTETHPPPPFR